ncbi:MAG TPA: C25 family cysteine peptidase, partial [Blastocatellia bacterium]|nr:C25 family cysteine peptidase [Blastocatellia bacterium]
RESLSVVLSMTCLNALFNDPRAMSLSEGLLLGEGGAVAVWASSAQSGGSSQAAMNQEVVRQLMSVGTGKGQRMTLGEATKRARRVAADADVRRSWILLGDPTLRVK